MKRTFIAFATALAVGTGSLAPAYAEVSVKPAESSAASSPSNNKGSGDIKDQSSNLIDSKKTDQSTKDLLDKQAGSNTGGSKSSGNKGSSPTGSSPLDLLLIGGVVGVLVVKLLQTLKLDPASFPPELQGLIQFVNSGNPVYLHSS